MNAIDNKNMNDNTAFIAELITSPAAYPLVVFALAVFVLVPIARIVLRRARS